MTARTLTLTPRAQSARLRLLTRVRADVRRWARETETLAAEWLTTRAEQSMRRR